MTAAGIFLRSVEIAGSRLLVNSLVLAAYNACVTTVKRRWTHLKAGVTVLGNLVLTWL
jgi:hypothetical protein